MSVRLIWQKGQKEPKCKRKDTVAKDIYVEGLKAKLRVSALIGTLRSMKKKLIHRKGSFYCRCRAPLGMCITEDYI